MKGTIEPKKWTSATENALLTLATELGQMPPEMRKAASYILEHPNEIGISSIREIAGQAKVKPNTLVRMARTVGFDGFDDFRDLFRQEIRRGVNFPDRVRRLQSFEQRGRLGGLYGEMINAAIGNLEQTFAQIDEKQLSQAAKMIWQSRQTFALGVGVNSSNVHNFTYLARTGMVLFYAIPRPGSTAVDDLAWADHRDVLIAITCKPYRTEVINAVGMAKERGVPVIGISDSAASPILVDAEHRFIVKTETPQMFPSSVSTIALLETLLSFVFAAATSKVAERVKAFHDRRYEIGIYAEEPQ